MEEVRQRSFVLDPLSGSGSIAIRGLLPEPPVPSRFSVRNLSLHGGHCRLVDWFPGMPRLRKNLGQLRTIPEEA